MVVIGFLAGFLAAWIVLSLWGRVADQNIGEKRQQVLGLDIDLQSLLPV